MKQKNMAQPPTITQTLQADRITWLQIPTTFHEKGGGGRVLVPGLYFNQV